MDVLELARWQFGITTVFHYVFVPITIGLSFLVAGLQTAWHRTDNPTWLRLTKLFGTLLLVNIAVGVATGLVQEFQFGMNWSDYSRFVGDVFGAPLAMEALLAFYLESVFVGVWIFGWNRLPRRVHLGAIWLTAVGSLLSAYFILAANSFMQNPVGYAIDPETGRATMTDIGAVLTNPVLLVTFPHTIAGAFMVGGGLMAAVAIWHLRRASKRAVGTVPTDPLADPSDPTSFRSALRLGAVTVLVGGIVVAGTGDLQGKVMTEVQPMKMAAAEALYETQQPAPFSLLTIGTLDGSEPVWQLEVPQLLSFLATGDFNGEVQGIDDLTAQYRAEFGDDIVDAVDGEFAPNIPVTYWTFRLMITAGMLAAAIAAWMLWSTRRGRAPTARTAVAAVFLLPVLPVLANSFGWIFTEMGRQPWVVFGLLPTASGVSPASTVGSVLTSMIAFTALYGLLMVLEVRLLMRFARRGLPVPEDPHPVDTEPEDAEPPMSFAR